MRLSLILTFATLFNVTASVYSQSVKVNLDLKNATLETVFKSIQDQTEFDFFYKNEHLPQNKVITKNYKNTGVDRILDEVLEGTGLIYRVLNTDIVVTKAPPSTIGTGRENLVLNQQPTKTITGTVTDDMGQPLPGVTVVVKGTTQGTVTNADGDYSIVNIPDVATLVFSFVGMRTQEVVVGNQTIISVTMEQDVIGIDEVVAIGYGVAKKSDLTGAITQVKADDLNNYRPSNVSELLRTTIPGLNVGYTTSAKGNNSLLVRGETTLTAGSSPLIVVDGVIFNGDLSDINPDDIDRMDVMKDASSAAVYGSRATNGVISITTKRGTSDTPVIQVSSTFGLATSAKRLRSYDADGFIQWRSDWFKSVYRATVQEKPWSPFDDPRTIDSQYLNDWLEFHSTSQENMVDAWLSGIRLTGIEQENYKAGKVVNWEDVIYQNGFRQDYNVSLSGKTNKLTYYWSLGYMENEALTIGEEFSTIRSRVNLEGQVGQFLKVGLNTQFSFRDESSVSANNGYFRGLSPYGSYYANDGVSLRLYTNDDHQQHPLLDLTYRERERQNYTIFPKIYSVLDLPFGITYTMNLTTRMEFYHEHVHDSSEHPEWGLFGGSASRNNVLRREWQIDNIINWSRTLLDAHRFDVTLLANAEKYRSDSEGMSNRGFSPNDVLGYHDISTGILPILSSSDQVQSADALMARLNYGYNNRYLLTLSARRDGSSLFGYSNPRATFPAAAFGWVISEESFFAVPFIDYLKFRASWGVNGNRAISNYAALSRIATGKSLNADQNGVAITIPTLVINSMENKNLRWERTEALNLGFDFNIFGGIVSGGLDIYDMSTTDVLVNRSLPSITGFDRVYANLGEVRNKGLEITLNSNNIKNNNFEWRTNFIFSLNRNKIVSITGEKFDVFDENGNVIGQKEPDDKDNNWFIGQAKDVVWDFNILGTWKVGEEVEAAKWQQFPGDYRLEDVNGDGLLTDEDKQFIGYQDPRFAWTMTNNFNLFKNIEASFVLYSLWGQMSSISAAKHDGNTRDRYNDWDIPYWTPENQIDNYSRLASSPPLGVAYNPWFDRSYIRLENMAIAYKMPGKLLNEIFLDTVKFSMNIRNVAVWAPGWDYGDPEDPTRAQRVFSFGINLTM